MKAVIPQNFRLTVIGVPALDNSAALPRGLHVAPTAPLLVPERAKNRPGGLEYLRAMLSRDVAAKVSAETDQLTVVRGCRRRPRDQYGAPLGPGPAHRGG